MFTSAEKEYGVETKYVLEIIETNGIIPLPGTSEGIKGVIDLRGVLVPVLHLGEGLLSSEHIMVVKVSGKPYGIMVDRVVEVFEVDETQIDRTGHVLVRECPYIK